jgi:F0F1-type ATP synthase membrane subunit c/vacuolar-type H+-ATPase subunit K
MRKRIAVTGVALMLGLAACGSSEDEATKDETTNELRYTLTVGAEKGPEVTLAAKVACDHADDTVTGLIAGESLFLGGGDEGLGGAVGGSFGVFLSAVSEDDGLIGTLTVGGRTIAIPTEAIKVDGDIVRIDGSDLEATSDNGGETGTASVVGRLLCPST